MACGQIVKNIFICDEVRDALAQSNISKKKWDRIKNVTVDNFLGKDLQLISNSLHKYTDAYQNKTGAKAPMGSIVKGLMTSPDYTMKDFKAIVLNGYKKNTSLWREILKINLSEQLSNVKIPYVILQGDTDIVASTKQVKELVDDAGNSYLSYKVVPNTGHLPGVEMMDMLLSTLKEQSKLFE